MTDKPLSEEEHRRTEKGFSSIVDGLTELLSTQMEFYGSEEQKRGLPPGAIEQMGIKIGSQIKFEDIHPGGRSDLVEATVTGIFFDGFAYKKVRAKNPGV